MSLDFKEYAKLELGSNPHFTHTLLREKSILLRDFIIFHVCYLYLPPTGRPGDGSSAASHALPPPLHSMAAVAAEFDHHHHYLYMLGNNIMFRIYHYFLCYVSKFGIIQLRKTNTIFQKCKDLNGSYNNRSSDSYCCH